MMKGQRAERTAFLFHCSVSTGLRGLRRLRAHGAVSHISVLVNTPFVSTSHPTSRPSVSVAPSASLYSSPPPPHTLTHRIRPDLRGILLGCLCLAATNALGLAIPWLLKNAIDTLRGAHGAPALAKAGHLVAWTALVIVGCALVQAVIRTWSRVLIFNSGRNIEYRLRRDLFSHLARLDAGFYRRHPTGDLMSRLTNDLSAVRMLFGPGLLNIVNTMLVYASTVWLLLHLSPRLTLFALIPYPVLILGGRVFTRAMYRASRDLQDQIGHMSTAVQEDLAGIAVIKQYALEPQRHAAFAEQSRRYLERSLKLVRARGTLTPLFALIGGVGTLIVLWIGGREVINGHLSVGGLVAFNAYLVYLSWPTVALGWILSMWQRGVAGWVRVRELLDTVPEIGDAGARGSGIADADADGRTERTRIEPSIEVRGLSIVRDGRAILDQVSFSLAAGDTLAIVGRTGAGKTTLVDSIPRLTEVPTGTIFVGGRDVTTLPLRALRALVGYAPQEAFLFSATIAENIAFGAARRDIDRPTVERAAQAAGLTRDIAAFPDGYDTIVGERGITLSGGQRQRVALARALCADPQILILDDSLSSVDAETERDILARLRPILAGRTSILVSHRVAAVKDASQILVIDAGRVAERGTHAQLLASGGVYAALYHEQLAAEKAARAAAEVAATETAA
jgi:ATP-binding cassette subfamily B multidrug efflux pump